MNCKVITFRTSEKALVYTVLDNTPPRPGDFVEIPKKGQFVVGRVTMIVIDNYNVHATVVVDKVP